MTWTSGSGGTVSSVGMSVPAFLSISGSPVTSSGTLAVTLSGTALPVLNGGTGSTTSTGSGSVVLAAAPTLTGTTTLATANITTCNVSGAVNCFTVNTSSTSVGAIAGTIYAPSNTTNAHYSGIELGVANTTFNSARLMFYNASTGSTSNAIGFLFNGLFSSNFVLSANCLGQVNIPQTIASTSTSSGSLIVNGGAGIAGQVSCQTIGLQGSGSGIITIQPQAVAG